MHRFMNESGHGENRLQKKREKGFIHFGFKARKYQQNISGHICSHTLPEEQETKADQNLILLLASHTCPFHKNPRQRKNFKFHSTLTQTHTLSLLF